MIMLIMSSSIVYVCMIHRRCSYKDNSRAMPQTTEIDDNSYNNCDRDGWHMAWCLSLKLSGNQDLGMTIVMTFFVVSGNHRGWGEDGLGLVEGSWGREDGTNPLCWGDSGDGDDGDNHNADLEDLEEVDSRDGYRDDVRRNDNYDRMSNYTFISSPHDLEGNKHSRCQDVEHLPKERLHCRGNCHDGLRRKKTIKSLRW